MKLSKFAEIGTTLGAATLVGLNALQHKRKEEEEKKHKHSIFGRIAFYSSLIAAGLALWDMKKHHHAAA